jgi:hypothetical protein
MAGFLFGSLAWIHEVPYDPHLYFYGEEQTLAVRLTNAWDFYGPKEVLIWHQYNDRKINRPLHWSDNPSSWHQLEVVALARMRRLVGMDPLPRDPPVDLTGFDLGSARTLEQYQRFSGIDFKARTIAPHALASSAP